MRKVVIYLKTKVGQKTEILDIFEVYKAENGFVLPEGLFRDLLKSFEKYSKKGFEPFWEVEE